MTRGFSPPTGATLARPTALKSIAVKPDVLAFDFSVVSDHVIVPEDVDSRRPYD